MQDTHSRKTNLGRMAGHGITTGPNKRNDGKKTRRSTGALTRAVDPDSWNRDPDPSFQLNPDPDLIRIQGFDDQKLKKKILQTIFLYLFYQKLQFTFVQAAVHEKSSALKTEHPARQKIKLIKFFSMFLGHFCPPGSGSGLRIRIRILIQGPH
jgi:hypothetical protein